MPILLDGTQEERLEITAEIPTPPRIDLKDISVEDVERRMREMERASEARLPREVVDETDYEQAEDFILDKNQLPVNWSLQLGSFSNEDNAVRLREKLREENYRTYILHARTGEGDLYRVFVGPSSSKESLSRMNDAIASKFSLKGKIVRYRIEEDKEQLGG